ARLAAALAEPFFCAFKQLASQGNGERPTMPQGGRLLTHTRAGRTAFLDALIGYWGAVSDLVQRQEHGGQREGAELTWHDARRVVFQVAMVMFEVDSALGRSTSV